MACSPQEGSFGPCCGRVARELCLRIVKLWSVYFHAELLVEHVHGFL